MSRQGDVLTARDVAAVAGDDQVVACRQDEVEEHPSVVQEAVPFPRPGPQVEQVVAVSGGRPDGLVVEPQHGYHPRWNTAERGR